MSSQEFSLKQVQTVVDETTTANVTYIGRAQVGTKTSDKKWQIFIVDKTVVGITATKWACQADGTPTKEFEFDWDSRATITYALSV